MSGMLTRAIGVIRAMFMPRENLVSPGWFVGAQAG